ncbi:MAG: hypothetical protein ACW991_02160 [Candidatus Hodarchaeales archaeon]|jgi:hypothetical protein
MSWIPLILLCGYYICAYFIAIVIGGLFVGLFLKSLNISLDSSSEKGLPGAGKIIGMLERGIILTFGLLGEFGAISFVFVAKSMARFKQLEKRQFAEYYLIGTLLSFFFTLIVAIVAQGIYITFFLPLLPE